MILVGESSLWIALVMVAWATAISFAGGRRRRADLVASGERGLIAAAGFTVLASAGLLTALVTHDVSLRYVASYTSASLPTWYTLSAFSGGPSGSFLFSSLILSACATIAVLSNRTRNREIMPWVTATLAATLLLLLGLTALGTNPFERLDWIPADGHGMSPELQNPGMAIHQPILYLGYAATAVPFAFAVGALVSRRLDAAWLDAVRRWALTSWLFLTIGITLGMWSAYVEPGRGGQWAWDPVQNASLFPWLAGTAFLHSIMVQEERGTLRNWTVTLVIGTFLLAVLGTVLRRGGIEQGVPAFVTSPAGPWFAGVLLLALVVSVVLVATRLKDFEATAERERQASRAAEFPHHNVLRHGITFSVLWGTLFPVLSAAVTGSTITIGPPSFNAVNFLLGLALLGLTGIGPLLVWRRASVVHLRRQLVGSVLGGLATGAVLLLGGMRDPFALVALALAGFVTGTIAQEFLQGMGARRRMYAEGALRAGARLLGRNRRRYGGYILHAGMTFVIAAFAGLAFRKEYDIALAPGERFTAKDAFGHSWSFTSNGLSRFDLPNRHVVALNLSTARDGGAQPNIVSEQRQQVDSRGNPAFEPSTQSGILHALRQDVHVVLAEASPGDRAEVRITFNPLVAWVWCGGMIIALGGLIVLWPQATGRGVQSGNAAPLAPEGAIVGTTAP